MPIRLSRIPGTLLLLAAAATRAGCASDRARSGGLEP